MIPLSVFLLACASVYLGAIEAAFSALMRLSLRLAAERTNRPGGLGTYSSLFTVTFSIHAANQRISSLP